MRSLALLALCVGCSGGGSTNVKPTLVFADRSDAEIARLLSAAGGGDMFFAEAEADQFAGATDPCPGVAISGATATMSGGCTTTDGTTLAGTAATTNDPAWGDQIQYQFGADTVYTFTGFTLTQSTLTTSFDGRVTVSDNSTTWDADLTANQLGIAVRSDLFYQCELDGQTVNCDIGNSGLELVGVGGVLLSGSIATDTAAGHVTSSFTLQGQDKLTATITNGCVAWQIAGTTRQKTCP